MEDISITQLIVHSNHCCLSAQTTVKKREMISPTSIPTSKDMEISAWPLTFQNDVVLCEFTIGEQKVSVFSNN